MINPQFFFYPYLPQTGALAYQLSQIVLKYPEVDQWFYWSVIAKILSSLEETQQKEFLYQLQVSEQAAGDWIQTQSQLTKAITEQLERSILLASSKLL